MLLLISFNILLYFFQGSLDGYVKGPEAQLAPAENFESVLFNDSLLTIR